MANRGSDLILECAAEGIPVPRVTWEKYGGHLPVGRFTQFLGISYLLMLIHIVLHFLIYKTLLTVVTSQ